MKAADRLAKRLGPKWRPIVWENLGWHFQAQFGGDTRLQVSGRHEQNYFWANFRMLDQQYHASGPTPEKALAAVCTAVRKHLSQMKTMYRFLERL